MTNSRFLLILVFALSAAFLVQVVAGAAQEKPVAPPTDAEFQAQIKRLDQKNPVAERLAAVQWLDDHSKAKNAGLAIPQLEQTIRRDPESKVREQAVVCLGWIVMKRKEPCPLLIIETILDKDLYVSQMADGITGNFKKLAPGSVEVLLRVAESDDARIRGSSLLHLARFAGKDKNVLAVIEKATRDKNPIVRCSAQNALFQANDNLEEYLVSLLRLQEDTEAVWGPMDADTKEGMEEITQRNLAVLSSVLQINHWTENRADDLARVLIKLLASDSPKVRRGAARLVGASAVRVDSKKFELNDVKKQLFPGEEPIDPANPPVRSKAAIVLEKLKVEDRLREMLESDKDPSVRSAVRVALERFAKTRPGKGKAMR